RQWPTTWAKRLAFGRDPRGWLIEGRLIDLGGRNATASEPGSRVSTALSECDCYDADCLVAGAAGDLIR
ncbi:MAG TPA: hypothetical protein VFX03_00835, partial [Thermomicrobiales bacterium]|nr:hypothetical protein [Thermomicrobiales bacterium]